MISTRRSSSRKSAGQHAAVDAVDSRKPTTAAPANKISTAVPGEDSLQITLLTAASLLVSIAAETIVSCKPAAATATTTYSVTVDIPLP